MQFEYYALRRAELSNVFRELDQAAITLDQAKDKQIREEAKNLMERAAHEALKIDPHLSYLWFWARKEEAEKEESERTSEIANSIRHIWHKGQQTRSIPDAFQLSPDVSAVKYMPPLSFMLCIRFKLQKPYISKDERDFYLLDNPIRKEKIFQAPMVAATSWKGALRAALWQLGYKENNEIAIRLLGNPRDSDKHRAGRLYFYPTFFDKIGLEVLNPHSRETGVGERGPILMECVPEGVGTLLLLYVPFGPVKQKENERRAEVAQDLEALAEGVQAMLTTYGFGGKISSGFGTAYDKLAGESKLALRAELPDEATPATTSPETGQPTPALPRYLVSTTQLHPDFCQPDGGLKLEAQYQVLVESRGQKYTKNDRQLYAKAKSWWAREGQQPAEAAIQKSESEADPAAIETLSVSEWTFSSLSEMRALAQSVAARLREVSEA
ncbi:hypothetical protein HY02_06420 [Peptococcaceae bacterium SCADC1_2_3]|nr:hypothetical protein DK28_0212560 [Peptococcaceae bacterium SCADC1_2_3]KFI37477.1 hypothetical protein HY02_06420 [Peptococcaceae bacterium SCADC1_2_3]